MDFKQRAHLQPRFDPTRNAALGQISRVNPDTYAKTRNFVDGAVTKLSPWMTHGFVTTREAAQIVCDKQALSFEDKLIFEFCWREFFHHVHSHLGDQIFRDIRRPVYNGRYQERMPADILEARTGVAAIDEGIKLLYGTGYIHNHIRMWIASYVVHFRKVSWRAGADWMYGYLLDGDLASNHLSWQWVAGTFSHKPYLFNAANVDRYAKFWPSWNTSIDQSYEDLADMAKTQRDLGPEPGAHEPGIPPERLSAEPPAYLKNQILDLNSPEAFDNAAVRLLALNRKAADGEIRLIHPWDLGAVTQMANPRVASAGSVGLIVWDFHSRFKWSYRRWEFVMRAMNEGCDLVLGVSLANLQKLRQMILDTQTHLAALETFNPAYSDVVRLLASDLEEETSICILPKLSEFQQSFSRYYNKACRRAGTLQSALNGASQTAHADQENIAFNLTED